MKLTERAISGLTCPNGKKDRLVSDDAVPGLFLRVSAGGGKAFLAQYTIGGTKRRVPIGRWGALTLDTARDAAKAILGSVAQGRDPAAERRQQRDKATAEAIADKLTFAAMVDQWSVLALASRRNSYKREAVRAIRVAFPHVLSRRADAISRADVVTVLDTLETAGKAPMAARTLAYLRAAYSWAVKRGKLAHNPCEGLSVAAGNEARDRVLSDDEIGHIWRGTGQLGHPFGPLLRLLLLTAQRRNEVASMAWPQLSADLSTWTIPKERAKNGRAHVVHLSSEARAILVAVPRIAGSSLVFSTTGKTAPSGFSKATDRLNALIETTRRREAADASQSPSEPMPLWWLHDFRRTTVSWLASNGTQPHVADKLLNHVTGAIGGVAAVYNRAEFLPERKAALERWAAHVVRCGEGVGEIDNVVPLRAEIG